MVIGFVRSFYRTMTIKFENVEHQVSSVVFLASYLDVTQRIRASGSKQPSSSFASLIWPTLPLVASYLRAGLIGGRQKFRSTSIHFHEKMQNII